ncbi:MAG: XdhC family protein, partial [Pseudomonadota bacterium]
MGRHPPRTPVWIWGAGHVGRALATALTDLPFDVTWVDDAPNRFPEAIPHNATKL